MVYLLIACWIFPWRTVSHNQMGNHDSLVGGIPTPLKNMCSSVGMINPFPTEWKVIKAMFQTTNQSVTMIHNHHFPRKKKKKQRLPSSPLLRKPRRMVRKAVIQNEFPRDQPRLRRPRGKNIGKIWKDHET